MAKTHTWELNKRGIINIPLGFAGTPEREFIVEMRRRGENVSEFLRHLISQHIDCNVDAITRKPILEKQLKKLKEQKEELENQTYKVSWLLNSLEIERHGK